MDRRSFFAAFFGALTGGLVVEAVRAAAVPSGLTIVDMRDKYAPPKVTFIGRIATTDPDSAFVRFTEDLQRLNTALPTFGDCPRFSIDDLPR